MVTGFAVTYPFGGVFWDYIQYPVGLQDMGHEVLYLEDAEDWCYDPFARTTVESGQTNARAFESELRRHAPALVRRWHFRDAAGNRYGLPLAEVARYCRGADLLINVSFACTLRDEYVTKARLALIDSDPMFTQSAVPAYLAGTADPVARRQIEDLLRHDVFFTFGENVGSADCHIPTDLVRWHPTRQPVVLDRFEDHRQDWRLRKRKLTTVGSWERAGTAFSVRGVEYGWKGREMTRFLELPSRSAVPLELALSGEPPVDDLRARGWSVVDALAVSENASDYRAYLATSFGEWSVAKHAYVASRSGWFSTRSACYLALGVPVVVQDTGFGCALPTGRGILRFSTLEEASAQIAELASHPERHGQAAVDIAEEHFDSTKVLGSLIDRCFAT